MKIEKKYDVMTKSQWIEKFLFSCAKMYFEKDGMNIYYATGGESMFIQISEFYPYKLEGGKFLWIDLLSRLKKGGERE